MDQAAIDQIEQQIDGEVKKRFPGAVRRVTVLQYGDDPVIEPGGLLVRVIIEAPEGREGQQEALQAFEKAHGPALKHFRHDLSAQLPEAGPLDSRTSDTGDGPRLVLGDGRARGSLQARALDGGGAADPGDGPARACGPRNTGRADHSGHRSQPRRSRPLGPGSHSRAASVCPAA